MKKASKSLSLALMGSLTVALSGCGSDDASEEFRAYQTIDECVAEKLFTPQECREMAIAAVKQNPQFNSLAECEEKFGEGGCKSYEQEEQTATGERRSSWMPLLAGYMAGRYLGGGGMMQSAQPLYPQQQPQQTGATGGRVFRTLGGATLAADAKGKVPAPSAAVREGFTRSAKPYAGRTGGAKRSGFSGGRSAS